MDKRLGKIMKETLGVTIEEVERLDRKKFHDLYEKALENEEIKAVEAIDTTENGETQESIDAAHIVNWLWEKSKKFRAA